MSQIIPKVIEKEDGTFAVVIENENGTRSVLQSGFTSHEAAQRYADRNWESLIDTDEPSKG